MTTEKGDYIIDTNKARLNIKYIHEYLSVHSYWAEGIPLDIVEQSIAGSLCFGLYHGQQQVGFARVISDSATFAWLADVFVDPGFRGKGLSKWMMEVIMAHPGLQTLRGFMLGTRDAHSLYQKYGFQLLDNPGRFMRLHFPDRYKNR